MRVRTTKIDIFIVCRPLNVDTLEKQLFLKRDWHWKLDLDGERQDGYSVMVTPSVPIPWHTAHTVEGAYP
jgi:hypothetical protein